MVGALSTDACSGRLATTIALTRHITEDGKMSGSALVILLLVIGGVYAVIRRHKGRNTGAGDDQTPTTPGEDKPKK